MLAAPGKTYITVCLPLFSPPPPPPSLSFISLPQSLLPLLSVQLISKDLMGMACLTSFFSWPCLLLFSFSCLFNQFAFHPCFSFLHTKVPDPYTLLFFSSSPSLHPLCVSSHFLISLSHLTQLFSKCGLGTPQGSWREVSSKREEKKTCFRYNSIHKLPRARMYRYFGFHALALIKHLKAKLSSDGGPRSYLCQFKGLWG